MSRCGRQNCGETRLREARNARWAWPREDTSPSRSRSYTLAICASGLFLPIAWIFDTPVSSFLVAIFIASFLGNRLAGYLTAVFSTALFIAFFFQTIPRITFHGSGYGRLAFLIGVGCLLPELAERAKRLERGRIRSEADFRTLVQTCPDPILLIDASEKIIGSNMAATEMFGFEHRELLGRSITMLLPKFAVDGKTPRDLEGLPLDGDPIKVSATWVRLGDRTSVFLRDVTDRRRTETELKISEENLRLLVETIPGLVYVRDAKGRLQQVNHRVVEFNGIPFEELVRDNGFSAVHPDDRKLIEPLFERSFPLGVQFSYEFRHRRADGVYRWFNATARPLKNASGEVIRWYSLLTDVDDRRALEVSVREMQATLAEAARVSTVTEIAASVVHEISQPLSAIISNSQACLRYLASETLNRQAVVTAVERTLRSGRDASQTVKNIRTLFHRRNPDTDLVDIGRVIDEVLLLHEAQIRNLGIKVTVSIDAGLPFVSGDRLQIQQVLVNLVSNAIESMESSAPGSLELEIRSSRDSESVLTEVADRGHGLRDPERVFDLFFTTKESGMGIGLRICKTIVETHQGKLWAEPRLDKGTKFMFALPVARGTK